MARRKKKYSLDPFETENAIGMLTLLGVIWVIGQVLQQVQIVVFAIIAVVALAIVYPVMRALQRADARDALREKVEAMIERQIGSLVRRRAQLARQDAYGKQQWDGWHKEIDYFITHHIDPSLTSSEHSALGGERAMVANLIEERVFAAMRDQPAFQAFSSDMTPAEFEVFCAEELRRAGWNARVTSQSRDQGVDVVAEKGSVRVVLQCKLYERPVGNKSVQEAAAAKAHEQASYGIVVSNNRYTPAAEQLASTNGILLLHYRDLQNLDNLLR
ncbi:MAG: restriction endonuclease [Methylocella sp.]